MSEAVNPEEQAPPPSQASGHGHHPGGNIVKMAVGAMGVVFGDIGTSPLMRCAIHSLAIIRSRSTRCTCTALSA